MAETALAASRTPRRQARKRALALATSAVMALGGVIAAPIAAQAAVTPTFTAEATEVAGERVDIAIEGSGFDDVRALPGQAAPHAYFTLVEKDVDLSDVSDTDTAISATVAEDGTVSDVLSVPASELAAGTSYEVISWPSRSFPTDDNLYARADVAIDWAALFPAPVYEPVLAVAPAADLDPAGDVVTVTGSGYNPAQGIYVFVCADVELPADLWNLALGCREGAQVVFPTTGAGEGKVAFDEEGSFELELDVKQLGGKATSVYTAANHTAPADRGQDAKATLAFAEPQPEPGQPSFTADVAEVPNERVDIAIEGSGFDEVRALPGQAAPHAYFTLVEKDVDLSDVSDTDTAISATVAEDGTVSDVLSVPASELVAGTSYEVISWPSRSFPTDDNLYARADVAIDWAALFPDDEEPGIPGTEEPGEETPGDETPGNETPGAETPGDDDRAATPGSDSRDGSAAGGSTTSEDGDALVATGIDGAQTALLIAGVMTLLGAAALVMRRRMMATVEH